MPGTMWAPPRAWNSRRFAAFVRRAERQAKERPKAYRRAVLLFVLLGYSVLYSVALGVLAIAGLLIWHASSGPWALWTWEALRVGGPGLFLVVFVVLWLRVPLDRPAGWPLAREQAPRLFAIVDGMARALGVPPPDQILLTLEMNAALAQTPRHGLLGEHTDLVLGVPLLLLLSPDEVRAVIGHELGHRRGHDSRFSGLVYGLELAWARLAFAQQITRSALLAPLVAFARWYAPRLAAQSFAMRREQELAADRASAEVAGAKIATSALVAVSARAEWFAKHFMRSLIRSAARDPTPPPDLLARLCRARAEPVPEPYLASVLARPTDPLDSHPSLSDRLRALGAAPEALSRAPLPPPAVSAAEQWLADSLPIVIEKLNRAWALELEPAWQARQLDLAERRRALSALPAEKASSREALWARAKLCRDMGDDRQAVLVLREMLVAGHRDAEVLFLLGLVLADHGDDRCVELLEEAAKKQVHYAAPALSRALTYALSRGHEAQAERLRPRLVEAEGLLFVLEQERQWLGEDAALEPPALPAADEVAIRAALQTEKNVDAAYVVRRAVERHPEHVCHWVLIAVHASARSREDALVASLAERLDLTTDVRIAPFGRLPRALRSRIAGIPAAWWGRPFRSTGDRPLASPGFLGARPLEGVLPRRAPAWVTIFWLSLLASIVSAWAALVEPSPDASGRTARAVSRARSIPLVRFEEPLTMQGRLENVPSGSRLMIDDPCAVAIEPADAPRLNCRVTVRCGGTLLYGASPHGLAICEVDEGVPIAAFDVMDRKTDGDPWLYYEGREGLLVIDDERRANDTSETVIRVPVRGAEH